MSRPDSRMAISPLRRPNVAVWDRGLSMDTNHQVGSSEHDAFSIQPRFERLVELVPDAVFLHGLDGKFFYVNEAATAMLGYERDELFWMHPWDFVINDNQEEIL